MIRCRELNNSVRKEIEKQNLINYFTGKKYIENEINSFFSENRNLK